MDNRNFILTGQARTYFWKGEGLCSIKTFTGGAAFYNTGKGNFRVEESQFLLLNEGTTYSIEIDQDTPVDSYCLFFNRELIRSVHAKRNCSDAYLLDHVMGEGMGQPYFERTYPRRVLDRALREMKARQPIFQSDDLWLEQELIKVVGVLEALHQSSLCERDRLSAQKPSTRHELYARLLRAREFIHGNYQTRLSLQDIALSGPLSVNHLLRGFGAVFRATPHGYLTDLRLTKAEELLAQTCDSVQEVAAAVGYESASSFSLLFKKRTGLSPERYRKTKKGDFR